MSFYCKIYSNAGSMSIDEWNKKFNEVKDLGEEIISLTLHEKPCTEQCFDCMAIVGETRLKNSKL